MHADGGSEPASEPVGRRVCREFGLTPASGPVAWAVAADRADELGDPIAAALMRDDPDDWLAAALSEGVAGYRYRHGFFGVEYQNYQNGYQSGEWRGRGTVSSNGSSSGSGWGIGLGGGAGVLDGEVWTGEGFGDGDGAGEGNGAGEGYENGYKPGWLGGRL